MKNMNLLLDLDEVLVHTKLVPFFTVLNPTGWNRNVIYKDSRGQQIKVEHFSLVYLHDSTWTGPVSARDE